MILALLIFVIGLAILAAALYFAAKITGNTTPYNKLFLIALIGAVCSAIPIPVIGSLIGTIVMIILLVKWANMSVLAAILTVILANILIVVVAIVLGLVLVGAVASASSSTGLILPLL